MGIEFEVCIQMEKEKWRKMRKRRKEGKEWEVGRDRKSRLDILLSAISKDGEMWKWQTWEKLEQQTRRTKSSKQWWLEKSGYVNERKELCASTMSYVLGGRNRGKEKAKVRRRSVRQEMGLEKYWIQLEKFKLVLIRLGQVGLVAPGQVKFDQIWSAWGALHRAAMKNIVIVPSILL